MATETTFNGKRVIIPGAYSQVKSGVNNAPLDFSYGNVLVIDKDPNNPFGGGSGISGELEEKDKSVYKFDNLSDFRSFIRGGELYDSALPLFRPSGLGSNGISNLYYVRAFTTTCSSLTLSFVGGGSNGGSLVFKSRAEGLAGNGVEGDEVKAKQSLNVTVEGSASDTCEITADGVALGSFVQTSGATLATTSAGIAAVINENTYAGLSHGYTATASGSQVTVYAPDNTGASSNGDSFAVANTGSLTSTVAAATMSGGVDGTTITRGLGVTMSAGTTNASKFILKFYRGSFTGNDSENQSFNGISESDSTPDLIVQTPEFDNVQEIIDWAGVNVAFNNLIKLESGVVNGTGVVDSTDLSNTVGNKLFSGGTQVYNTSRVDDILDVVRPLDFTFVYSMDGGANVQSVDNGKILASLLSDQKYEKFLVVGGGDDATDFDSVSITAAKAYNSDRVILVHGACNVPYQESGTGLKRKDSRYKAAHVLGRMAGLPPQTPVTFKTLGFASEVHGLSETEKEAALESGVLVTAFDHEISGFVVVSGINTLQQNTYALNSDGSSHLISLKRISAQLNKELEINMKKNLLGNQTAGPNRSTVSREIVSNYVEQYLKGKTATTTEDNLIISFQDITASFDQDSIKVGYSFVPNTEINKVFITGLIID